MGSAAVVTALASLSRKASDPRMLCIVTSICCCCCAAEGAWATTGGTDFGAVSGTVVEAGLSLFPIFIGKLQ